MDEDENIFSCLCLELIVHITRILCASNVLNIKQRSSIIAYARDKQTLGGNREDFLINAVYHPFRFFETVRSAQQLDLAPPDDKKFEEQGRSSKKRKLTDIELDDNNQLKL